MGNWSPAIAQRQREYAAAEILRREEIDRNFPQIDRPCGTPGAVYTIVVDGRDLGCTVHLPFDIDAAVPASAKEDMKRRLHDALLPIIETFYRDVWAGTIRGKALDGDEHPMPKKWGLLFERWIRRQWQRGCSAQVDGKDCRTWYALPDEYQWDRPSRDDCEGYGP